MNTASAPFPPSSPAAAAAAAATAAWLLLALGPVCAAPPSAGAASAALRPAEAASRPAEPGPRLPGAAKPAKLQIGCLIGPERVADVGSPVTGVVSDVVVERGERVRKGQTLVQLESVVEQAGVQAAQARANLDADIRAAEASAVLARQRQERMEGLVGQGFVSSQAVDQARAERDVADQKLAQAQAQRSIQSHELGIVRAQLGQRTVKAPFAGVVIDRFINAGERVEDKPLLRLAQVHPLRVDLIMPSTRWGSLQPGDGLSVQPELPGVAALTARVTHVDTVIDAASNTFLVRLALPNPDFRLPAGARCKSDGVVVQAAGGTHRAEAPAAAQTLAQRPPPGAR